MTVAEDPNLPVSDRPLTELQLRFVVEYIRDPSNATAACRRAGYSPETAKEQAGKLMANKRVRTAIKEAIEDATHALGISTTMIFQEIWKVAGANPGDIVSVDSEGDPSVDAMKAGEVSATTVADKGGNKRIKSVTVKTIKPADKIAALGLIAKMMDLFPEKKAEVEVTTTGSIADLIAASYDKGSKTQLTVTSDPTSTEESA